MFRADLHCHSTYSDGSCTPKELLDLAKQSDLQGLVITDHDSVAGYAEAAAYAKEIGIAFGSGVEFSCHVNETSVHILGYDFQADHPAITALCKKHHDRRQGRNSGILQKLAKRNMFVSEQELYKESGSVGRPHIARLMIQKGYVATIEQAFRVYLGEGKSCYERGELFSTLEAIDAIHQAGGKAFLAHPHLIRQSKIVKALLEMPFDGIECYYSRFDLSIEKKWCETATKKGWLISGGSDFHGTFKPETPLGCSWTNQESFAAIFSRVPSALPL